jgi:hypothetical protein
MSVTTTDPTTIARAVEAFSRTAAGLALEGLSLWIGISPDDDDDPT